MDIAMKRLWSASSRSPFVKGNKVKPPSYDLRAGKLLGTRRGQLRGDHSALALLRLTRWEKGRDKVTRRSVLCECTRGANLAFPAVHLHSTELPTASPHPLPVNCSNGGAGRPGKHCCLSSLATSVKYTRKVKPLLSPECLTMSWTSNFLFPFLLLPWRLHGLLLHHPFPD